MTIVLNAATATLPTSLTGNFTFRVLAWGMAAVTIALWIYLSVRIARVEWSSQASVQGQEQVEASVQDQNNRRVLRQMVRKYWVEGVLEHSLDYEAAIRLGIADRSSLVEDRPWRVIPQQTGETARTLPPGTSIVNVFDQMGQRMLILGEPGAGKTTALLELARALITRADDAPALPSPVVFNLSSWIQRKAPLADWLVDELGIRYSIPKKLAQAWIEHDKLLLLLDGLDEVQPELRSDCVAAINQFLQDHLVPLAVCSRLAEYESLSVRLKLHGAALLQPLTAEQIDDYLNRAGPALADVRTALQQDVELGELAKSPLMLSIMALAYQGVSTAELAVSDTTQSRRQHLFDAYIQRMFVRRETEPIYSPQHTLRWLQWLSARLVQYGQTVFLIERMQPGWLGSADRPVDRPYIMLLAGPLLGLMSGLILGLIYGLIFGLLGGLLDGLLGGLSGGLFGGLSESLISGLRWGLLGGLLGGLIVGLIYGLIDAFSGGFKQIHSLQPSGVLTNRLKSSLLAALFWGLIFGLSGGLRGGLISGLLGGLLGGLSGGLIGGLNGGFIKIEPARHAKSKSNLFFSLRFGLIVGLTFGLIVGLIGGLRLGLIDGLTGGLTFGLIVGLIGGLIGGLIFQPYSQTELPIMIETRVPNQGIRLAARYAAITNLGFGLIGVLSSGLILGLIGGLRDGLIFGLSIALSGGLIFGPIFGLIGAFIGGGDVVTKHCLLRIGLRWQGHIPWNYARFLDYATELIFLRKVGGGYIFVHRLIMEHFAALDEEDIERITAFSVSK